MQAWRVLQLPEMEVLFRGICLAISSKITDSLLSRSYQKKMSVLKFSLSPDSTGRIHDLLLCLAKFGEYVSFEAKGDQQVLRSTVSSRSLISKADLHGNSSLLVR